MEPVFQLNFFFSFFIFLIFISYNHNHYKFALALWHMITYNDIYEALRKEKYSEQLQMLPKKFIENVSAYLADKKKLASQEGDLFSEEVMKVKKQLENAQAIFNELILLRKKKLLGLVFVASETGISKRDFENMLDYERELFDSLIASVKNAEKKLLLQFNGVDKVAGGQELQMLLILEDVEELVDFEGNPLGPFSKGEIVNLDKRVADILVSDGRAELVSEE